MARKTAANPAMLYEAREAGAMMDPDAPGGEWYVRLGTIWRGDHPVVQRCPEWFVELGTGPTAAPFMPGRAA